MKKIQFAIKINEQLKGEMKRICKKLGLKIGNFVEEAIAEKILKIDKTPSKVFEVISEIKTEEYNPKSLEEDDYPRDLSFIEKT